MRVESITLHHLEKQRLAYTWLFLTSSVLVVGRKDKHRAGIPLLASTKPSIKGVSAFWLAFDMGVITHRSTLHFDLSGTNFGSWRIAADGFFLLGHEWCSQRGKDLRTLEGEMQQRWKR